MKILSVGNSFSQDAQAYLAPLAAADGVELCCVNLMIGGCSLARHAGNLLNDNDRYGYEVCGSRKEGVTLRDGVSRERWDIVTLQQELQRQGLRVF